MPERCRQVGRGFVCGPKFEARQQGSERVELILVAVSHRLGQQLRYQQDRARPGDGPRVIGRLDGEQRAHPPTEHMAGDRGVDQDVGVERVHNSAGSPGCAHVVEEVIGALLRDGRSAVQAGRSTSLERLAEALRTGHGLIGAARSERLRADDDRDRSAVPCDRHLFARRHPIEDLRECSAGVAGRHRGHLVNRT